MNNSEKVNPVVSGFFLTAFGLLINLGGLPFIISGLLFDTSTPIFWQIVGLIIGTLLILGTAISAITFGISFMIKESYPNKVYFILYTVVLSFLTLAIGLICYYFLYWITSDKEQSFVVKLFWIASLITFIFCLWYSYKKIKTRIAVILEQTRKIDEYLDNIFIQINDKKLTYGAAFLKIVKEIPEKHFSVEYTNKIIFAYEKLTLDEKEYDLKSFLNDKITLTDFYPLKSQRKIRHYL